MATTQIKWISVLFAVMQLFHVNASQEECVKNSLYEHPTECDKFYSCSPLGPVLMGCPSGLHFNAEYSICDTPGNANCYERQQHLPYNGVEPDFCTEFIYSHPSDCSKFFVCSPLGPVLMNCPVGSLFNPDLHVCDFPYNVDCDSGVVSIESDEFNSTAVHQSTSEYNPTTNSEEHPTLSTTDAVDFKTLEGSGAFTTEEDLDLSTTDNSELSTLSMTTLDESNSETETTTVTEAIEITTDSVTESFTTTNQSDSGEVDDNLCPKPIWPNPNDCSSFFMCGSTGPEPFNCPENSYFNPVLLVCDWEYNVDCDQRAMKKLNASVKLLDGTSDFTDSTTNEFTTYTAVQVETTEFTTDYITSTEFTTLPTEKGLCESDIYPHPNDCTKFYKCDSFGPKEFQCQDNLYFNPVLLVCDWPANTECASTVTEDVQTTMISEDDSTSTDDSNTDSYTKSNDYSVDIDNSSVLLTRKVLNEDTNSTCRNRIWPHPTDCNKFYLCESMSPSEITCPKTLHFSPSLLICTWPQTAGCKNADTAEITTISAGTTEVIQTNDDITTTSDRDVTVIHSEVCQRHIWMHEDDCTRFYLCGSNGPVEFQCPEDLHFDATLLVCVWSTSTNCSNDNILTTTTESLEASTLDISTENTTDLCPDTLWPHPNDCTKYYLCGDTGPSEITCPDSLNFSPSLLRCTWPQEAGCNEIGTTEETTTDKPRDTYDNITSLGRADIDIASYNSEICQSSIWPNQEDCTLFYLCGSKGPVRFPCPRNLHFDSVLLVCVWPSLANCIDISTTMSMDDTLTDTRALEVSTENVLNETTTELCPDTTWPHPNDCSKFYVCADTGPTEITCPDDLHFSPSLRICTWPYSAGCMLEEQNTEHIQNGSETSTISSEFMSENCSDIIWAHSTDCTKFFICNMTGPVEITCPDNLYFDGALLVCTLSSTSCNETNINQTTTESGTETTILNFTTENEDLVQTTNSTLEVNTSESCLSSSWSHPSDCTKFYVCDLSGPVEMTCPDGLHFDTELSVCNWPQNALCNL